jgi:hypothetical protein
MAKFEELQILIFQSGGAHLPLGPDVRFVIVTLVVIFSAVSGQGKA